MCIIRLLCSNLKVTAMREKPMPGQPLTTKEKSRMCLYERMSYYQDQEKNQAFNPTNATSRRSGAYNSTTLDMLSNDAKAKAERILNASLAKLDIVKSEAIPDLAAVLRRKCEHVVVGVDADDPAL